MLHSAKIAFTNSADLVGSPGRAPPICKMQYPGQTSFSVEDFSKIRSVVSEEMRQEQTNTRTDRQTYIQTDRQAGRQTAKTLQQSFCWLDLRCRWSEQRRSWRSQRSSYSSHSTVRNSTHPTHAVQCKYTPTLLVREMNYSNVDCYYYHLFHRNSIPYFHFRKLPL